MKTTSRILGENNQDNLGDLKELEGTWQGQNGWNVVTLPEKGKPSGFIVLVQNYIETITFKTLGGETPNRGVKETQKTYGLEYELVITHNIHNNPVLHKENGMFLYLRNEGEKPEFEIARQASIPHGDVMLALGNVREITADLKFPKMSCIPIGAPTERGTGYATMEYGHFWSDNFPGGEAAFPADNVTKVLDDHIKKHKQTITKTTAFEFSTRNSKHAGVLNIPFVAKNANAANVDSTFYLEEVEENGAKFLQLQYCQQTDLLFMENLQAATMKEFPLINWPHINVNTLTKIG